MNRLIVLLSIALACVSGKGPYEIQVSAPDGSLLTVRAGALRRDDSGDITAGGRIEIRHATVEITCSGGAVVFVPDGKFSALKADGVIEATVGEKRIWGTHLFYDEPLRLLSMSGNPRAQEGKTKYSTAKRILCYTDTGVMKFEPKARIIIDRAMERRKAPRKRKKIFGLF